MKNLYHILKGRFLVSDEAVKNWRFIIFLSILALVMIASSHSADRKVHEIAAHSLRAKELRSGFVEMRSQLMKSRMESRLIALMEAKGLKPSGTPPYKIRIQPEDK